MEVDANEVLRVVLQFLQESGLEKTALALEEEANVQLNVVNDLSKIEALILGKDWSSTFQSLKRCQLPPDVMWKLYEETLGDLVDQGQELAAKEILRESEDLAALKREDGLRFDELQDLVYQAHSAPRRRRQQLSEKDLEKGRGRLAKSVCACLTEAGPSQLLQLMSEALAFRGELHIGSDEDEKSRKRKRRTPSLFSNSKETLASQLKRARKRGLIKENGPDEEGGAGKKILNAYAEINMGPEVTVNTACITWDGHSAITGTADGFIEVWNLSNGALRKDLIYQQEDNIMMHKKAILGLCASRDGQRLASTSIDGTVSIWDIVKGKRLERIKRAHGSKVPVHCVEFSSCGSRIATGGGDYTVRVFSAETSNLVQTLRGPQAQVNAVCFVSGTKYVASGSSDHKIFVWDVRSAQVVIEFSLDGPVLGLIASEWEGRTVLLATTRSSKLSLVVGASTDQNQREDQMKFQRIDLPCPNERTQFISGGFAQDMPSTICAVAEDGHIYFFKVEKPRPDFDFGTASIADIRSSIAAAGSTAIEGEALGLAHSPFGVRARVAVLLGGGKVKLLRGN